jgi:sterol desaturase/sphingolipid hydroxylase (fatty acid hydroxylase superfamily)
MLSPWLAELNWMWAPLAYFQRSGKRIFYIFLLSALAMVALRALWSRCSQGRSFISQFKSDLNVLFSPKIWFHRSSLADVQCLFLNNGIAVLMFSALVYDAKFVLIWLAHGLDLLTGFKGVWNHWPQWWVTILYTGTIFLATDFSRFILHYALHRFSFLWRFHKVHHSAQVLTPLTVYRAHPVEMILYRVRSILVVGIVSGLFYFLFMGKMKIWAILGVNGLGFLFNFMGSNLRHSQVWLGYGKLEKWLISPAQHQMHHNIDVKYSRSNIGSCLAIWDRMLGTHCYSDPVPDSCRAQYGVPESNANHNPRSWWSICWRPFIKP